MTASKPKPKSKSNSKSLPERLHLVDGTFELYRAEFSKRPGHLDPQGRDRKATMGVVSSLLWLLEDPDEVVTHIAVAFDNPIRSFRNDLFAAYKSDEGVPTHLREQFDPVEEAVRALGIVVWSMDRFEADDALAAGSRIYADDFRQIRLLTPDKDLGQCLRGTEVVQVDRIRKKLITAEDFRKTRGIDPESMPDWLALVGDTADGIPGLPGIGEKSASLLLNEYKHLENIPADPAEWKIKIRGAETLAETLTVRRHDALLYRKLAMIAYDVPLHESAADLKHKGVPRDIFEKWCDSVGAENLKDRPKKWRE